LSSNCPGVEKPQSAVDEVRCRVDATKLDNSSHHAV
jgi:hypothetical protein